MMDPASAREIVKRIYKPAKYNPKTGAECPLCHLKGNRIRTTWHGKRYFTCARCGLEFHSKK